MTSAKSNTANRSSTRRGLKDPKGGLTAAGRKHFNQKEGANLKPGVKKTQSEMTPEEMRHKGSFLRRHYANLRSPLKDQDGRPTRLALQAHAWGEPVPKTEAAAKRLAEKGERLLEKYRSAKNGGKVRGASKKGSEHGGQRSRRSI